MSDIIRDIRAIVRELWIIAFIFSLLVLIIHNKVSLLSIILAAAIATGYGLAFALNDYFDQTYDELNPEKSERNFFVRSGFSRNIALGILSVVILFILVPFAMYGIRGIVMFGISMFILWGYSSPPLRFKSRIGWDIIIPMLFMHAYPYALVLIVIDIPIKPVDIGIISLLLISSIASQLEQQIRDFAYDAVNDFNTTQWLGLKNSIRLMQFFTTMLVVVYLIELFLGILPLFIRLTALIYLIFIIPRFTNPKSGKNERNSRIATIAFFCIIIYMLFINIPNLNLLQ